MELLEVNSLVHTTYHLLKSEETVYNITQKLEMLANSY